MIDVINVLSFSNDCKTGTFQADKHTRFANVAHVGANDAQNERSAIVYL